jgi:glycosyltransferase involved in cell wall biosynthesis
MRNGSTLSVVTITLNEAARLEQCHRSIAWADEWVVVDSGSSDGTVELARGLSARVHERPFDDFSSQWNYAISQARGDWVLVLAADETVSAGLRREIESVVRRDDGGPNCYAMPRRNLHFGRWLRHGGQWPDWSLRLFRRGTAHWAGDIHEQLAYAGDLGRLRGPIIHRSFLTLSEWVQKMDRQTGQEAWFAARRGERAAWSDLTLRPAAWFLRMYVAQRGFLDGWAGFVHSVCTAVCIFFRYAKLRELSLSHEGSAR